MVSGPGLPGPTPDGWLEHFVGCSISLVSEASGRKESPGLDDHVRQTGDEASVPPIPGMRQRRC